MTSGQKIERFAEECGMILLRLILSLSALSVAVITAYGLLGHVAQSTWITPDQAASIKVFNSSRNQLLEAARLARERPQGGDTNELADEIAVELGRAPADAELWTTYAELQAELRRPPQQVADAVKMSYFAAPSDFGLMKKRLDVALVSTPMADQVLRTLVEGDIRAILLKQLDLVDELARIHRRAPEQNKAFLEQAVRSISPEILPRVVS